MRALAIVLLGQACVAAPSDDADTDVAETDVADTDAPAADTATDVRTYVDGIEAPTGDGRLTVALWLSGGAVRGPHDVTIALRDDLGPVSGLDVALDATMPAHGHGTRPVVVTEADTAGRYTAPDLDLTMVGAWRIEVEARQGDQTSRAAFLLSVDDR